MIRKILCPTDLTANSRDSLAYALRLAKANNAQLIVFHATSFPSFSQYPCELEAYTQWEQFVSRFKMDQILADAERGVRNFVGARFGPESNGVVWKPAVALGEVAEEIVRGALQEEVDLIVMARCKRGPLARVSGVASGKRWSGARFAPFSRLMQLISSVPFADGGCLR
jgi:nucleotide-binding universal stress UspA family protein